tara:strand:+ start:216 stop:374 length:159 start_codon:yes stop_codon:yes gene_type:complete
MFGYNDQYYMDKIHAQQMLQKLETDLKKKDLTREKSVRKQLVLKCLKYYFSL